MFWVLLCDHSGFDWLSRFFNFIYSSYFVGSEVRLREVKTEPSSMFFGSQFGSVQNGSNTGLVSIAITLKPAAAEVRNSVGLPEKSVSAEILAEFVSIDSTKTWSTEKTTQYNKTWKNKYNNFPTTEWVQRWVSLTQDLTDNLNSQHKQSVGMEWVQTV